MSLPAIAEPHARVVYARIKPAEPTPRGEHARKSDYVVIRRLRSSDAPAMRAMVQCLSSESRYARFHGVQTDARELERLTDVDPHLHIALGAFGNTSIGGVEGPIVGEARFIRSTRFDASAELAISVADAFQRRGLGELLVRQLVEEAQERGIRRLVAHVLHGTVAVRRLLARFGTLNISGQAVEVALASSREPRGGPHAIFAPREIRHSAITER